MSGTKTEPANSRRAVRTSEARRTGSSAPGGASSSSIGMRPAGCSIVISAVGPGGGAPGDLTGEAAGQHAGGGDADRPGRGDRAMAGARGEVARRRSCRRNAAEDSKTGLGMTRSATSPRPISGAGLAADGLQPREERQCRRRARPGARGRSCRSRRRACITIGIAMSMQLTSTPPIRSRTSPGRAAGGRSWRRRRRGSPGGSGRRYPARRRWPCCPRRSPLRPASGRRPRSACRY